MSATTSIPTGKIAIPNELINNFKCSQCKKYLSCGPIYFIHDTEETVCGQCEIIIKEILELNETKSGGKHRKVTRCNAYEAAASLLWFPCVYKENGCMENLEFSPDSLHKHECECNFKQQSCSIIIDNVEKKCNWSGIKQNLIEHLKTEHNNILIDNSQALEYDITENNSNTFVINAFEFWFILYVNINVNTSKFQQIIRIIGNEKDADNFDFKLKIKRHTKKMSDNGNIGFLGISQDTPCLELNIKNITDIFGDFPDTKFTVIINRKKQKIKCQFCSTILLDEIGKNICVSCSEKELFTCSNKHCTFITDEKLYQLHHSLICDFLITCPVCFHNIDASKILTHYKYYCTDMKKTVLDVWYEINSEDTVFTYLLVHNDKIFVWIICLDEFCMSVRCYLPDKVNDDFIVSLRQIANNREKTLNFKKTYPVLCAKINLEELGIEENDVCAFSIKFNVNK